MHSTARVSFWLACLFSIFLVVDWGVGGEEAPPPLDPAKQKAVDDLNAQIAKIEADIPKLEAAAADAEKEAATAISEAGALTTKIERMKALQDKKDKKDAEKKELQDLITELQKLDKTGDIARAAKKLESKAESAKKKAEDAKEKVQAAKQKIIELKRKIAEITGVGGPVGDEEEVAIPAELLSQSAKAENPYLEEELRFIDDLGEKGYGDLALAFVEELKKRPDWDGKPLDEAAKNYVNKAVGKILMQQALNSVNMDEKLELAQKAIDSLKSVVDSIKDDKKIMKEDAKSELVQAYFRLADQMVEIILQDQELLGGSENATVKAYLDKMRTKALAFYEEGFKIAVPLQEAIDSPFQDLLSVYEEALEAKKSKGALKDMEKALAALAGRKIKIQHAMERAWASWASLYPPGSPERDKILKNGMEAIDGYLIDYVMWPDDLQVYAAWMLMLGLSTDPVFPEAKEGVTISSKGPNAEFPNRYNLTIEDETDDAGKVTTVKTELPAYYNWYSDRLRLVFEKYVIRKSSSGKLLEGPVPDEDLQEQRIRALKDAAKAYFYSTQSAYAAYDRETNADKKQKLLAHAQRLEAEARRLIDEVAKPVSFIGPVKEEIQYDAMLKLKPAFHIYMARRHKAAQNLQKQDEELSAALEVVSAAVSKAPIQWKFLSRKQMMYVSDVTEIIRGERLVDPTAKIIEAEDKLRAAYNAKNEADAQKLFREVIALYLDVLDTMKEVTSKERRDAILPKALYNLGIAAIKIEDFYLGYIANFEVVQEFGPKLYDHTKFPGAAAYWEKAVQHMIFAADKQMKATGSTFDRQLYVDAIMLQIRDSKDPMQIVNLINLLKYLKQYEQALQFMDEVPKDNIYYRLVKLMAADICQSRMQKANQRIERIDARLAPPAEGAPASTQPSEEERKELTAEREQLVNLAKEMRAKVDAHARQFIELHLAQRELYKKNPPSWMKDPSDPAYKAWEQEKAALLSAQILPLSLALDSKEYAEVVKLADHFLSEVDKAEGLSDEKKQEFRAQGYWLKFVALYKSIDLEHGDPATVEKQLDEVAALQGELAKNDKTEQYLEKSISMIGRGYMTLGKRLGEEAEKGGDATLASKASELRKKSVEWFARAETVIYRDFDRGIMMGTTYSEEGMNDRAVELYRKVIGYWSESLFNAESVLAPGKTISDLTSATPEAAIASAASPLIDVGTIRAAAGKGIDALVEELNRYLTGTKLTEANKSAYQAVVSAAKQIFSQEQYKSDRGLQQAIVDAESLIARLEKAEEPLPEEQQKLNRIVLDFLYPYTLFRSPARYFLPTPAEFEEAVKAIGGVYRGKEGKLKEACLLAMLDPELIKGRAAQDLVDGPAGKGGKRSGGFKDEIQAKLKSATTDEEKQKYALVSTLFTPGLKALVYGVKNPQTGKIEERNYIQAGSQVAGILTFDKEIMPTPESELPIKDYLMKIAVALKFQNKIVFAKKRYAKSLVAVGKFDEALRYIEKLVEFFPYDVSLKLDLATVYTSMGATVVDASGAIKPRPYDAESHKFFALANNKVMDILQGAQPGSKRYWDGWLAAFENGLAEVKARKASGPAGEAKYTVEIERIWKGKPAPVKVESKPLDTIGKRLASDIARMVANKNPEPPEEWRTRGEQMLEELKELGFEPPKIEAGAEIQMSEEEKREFQKNLQTLSDKEIHNIKRTAGLAGKTVFEYCQERKINLKYVLEKRAKAYDKTLEDVLKELNDDIKGVKFEVEAMKKNNRSVPITPEDLEALAANAGGEGGETKSE